jgi:hypothetical protein
MGEQGRLGDKSLNSLGPDVPRIFRCPMRSGLDRVDHTVEIERALELGIVAVGWGDFENRPTTLEETYDRVQAKWNDSRAVHCIRRFAKAPVGSLVWSRHTDGTWLLGKLTGEWRPDYSEDAIETDMHQVRDCSWAPKKLLSERVPGKVIISFSYPGESWSEIHNPTAREVSYALYGELTGKPVEIPAPTPETVLKNLLDPFDVEDLVYAYLQVERGYLVLPKSRQTTNRTYEYAVVERDSGRLVPVSIKTGSSAVDVAELASTAEAEGKAIAYSTEGLYDGDDHGRVERIPTDDLLRFADQQPKLLPPRVRLWMEQAQA